MTPIPTASLVIPQCTPTTLGTMQQQSTTVTRVTSIRMLVSWFDMTLIIANLPALAGTTVLIVIITARRRLMLVVTEETAPDTMVTGAISLPMVAMTAMVGRHRQLAALIRSTETMILSEIVRPSLLRRSRRSRCLTLIPQATFAMAET